MKKMLLIGCILLLGMESLRAESVVTDGEMLTLLQAVGAGFLGLVGIPMLIVGLFCAGIRAIRGFFNF